MLILSAFCTAFSTVAVDCSRRDENHCRRLPVSAQRVLSITVKLKFHVARVARRRCTKGLLESQRRVERLGLREIARVDIDLGGSKHDGSLSGDVMRRYHRALRRGRIGEVARMADWLGDYRSEVRRIPDPGSASVEKAARRSVRGRVLLRSASSSKPTGLGDREIWNW